MLKKSKFLSICIFSLMTLTCLVGCNEKTNSSNPSNSNLGSNSSISSVDFLALTRRITYAKDNYLTEDNKDVYTEESYNALQSAVEEGEALLNKVNVTQKEVDDAVQKINGAIANLVSLIKPDKTLTVIRNFLDQVQGNYTLTVKDYYAEGATTSSPITYTIQSNQKAIYDEGKQEGYIAFDGYIHDFIYDENQKIKVGRVHLGEEQRPSVYLDETRLSSIINQIGISEAFTSIGLMYSFFEKVDGEKYYKTTSTTYFDLTLDLLNNRYQSYDGLNGQLSTMTMELSNDNVLNYKLYGQDMNDLWFDLTISNVGTTEIKDLESFLSNNSTYTSTYNPHEIAKKIVDSAKDEAYGLKFNVYSNKEGKPTQDPNYTISYKYDTNGSQYWLSSTGDGLIKSGNETKKITYQDNLLTIHETANYQIADIDILTKVIAQYESFTYMNKTDDYYYDIENENESEIKTALYRFFQLEKYSELADKNYFGESPSKIEIEDISAISITENDYNQFVLNVFQKTNKGAYGLIIRAILIDYQQVVIEELENAATIAKAELSNYYATIDVIKNDNQKYTDASFKVFSIAKEKAKEILEDQNASIQNINEILLVLKNRTAELQLASEVFDENGEEKIENFLDQYSNYQTSYQMKVTENNITKTYIAKYNQYFYCIEDNIGYIIADKMVHTFHLNDSKIVIDELYLNQYGATLNQIARIASYFGNYSALAGIEEYIDDLVPPYMARIHNSNKYFTTNIDYLSFIPNIDTTNIIGYSIELIDDSSMTIETYKSTSLSLSNKDFNTYENASMNRGEVQSTIQITSISQVKNDTLDSFMSSTDHLISIEEMLEKFENLPTSYTIQIDHEDYAIVGNHYYLNVKTNEFYAFINGKVNRYQFNPDFDYTQGETPYTLLEEGVKIDGIQATSLEEVVGSLNCLTSLTSTDLSNNVDESISNVYYTLNQEKITLLLKHLNINSENVKNIKITLSGDGSIRIIDWSSTYSINAKYSIIESVDEMTDIMISNIIKMESGEF